MTNSTRRKHWIDPESAEPNPASAPEPPPTPPAPVVEQPGEVAPLADGKVRLGRSGSPNAQALIHHNRGLRWRWSR